MDVTVIIPTHGRVTKLARCLSALSQQDLPVDTRVEYIIAIDGGAEREMELPRELPRNGRVLRLPRQGLAATWNSGVQEARGKLMIFTNDDTYPHRNWIREHLAAQALRGSPGMVVGESRWMDWPDATVFDGLIRETSMIFFFHKMENGRTFGFRHFWTCNASVPKWMIEKAGCFDERLRPYGFEDMELAYRIDRHIQPGVYYHAPAVNLHDHRITWADYCNREACLGRMAACLAGVNADCFCALYGRSDVESLREEYARWLTLDAGDHDAARALIESWAAQPLAKVASTNDWVAVRELLYRVHLPVKRRLFRKSFVEHFHLRDDANWRERLAMGFSFP